MTKEHGDQNDYNAEYYRCMRDGAEFFQYYFQGMLDYTSFGMRMSHKFLDTRYVSNVNFIWVASYLAGQCLVM